MKYLLPVFIATTFLISCGQNNKDLNDRNVQLLVDSTVFRNNNIYSDTVAEVHPEKPAHTSNAIAKKSSNSKLNTQPRKQSGVVSAPQFPSHENKESSATVPQPPVIQKTETTQGETVNNGETTATTGVPGTDNKVAKKGMNKAAQGAVIGGASGAVLGAIISKKKGLGAVVGAVAGAAGGYIIGKNKDKKDAGKN